MSDLCEKKPTRAAVLAASQYLLHLLGQRKGIRGELLRVREDTPDIWSEIIKELALEFDAFFARRQKP